MINVAYLTARINISLGIKKLIIAIIFGIGYFLR